MNCYLDRSGSLWFSVGNGDAFRIQDGKLHAVRGLEQGNVNWFLELESGEIWIGTENGLFTVKNDRAEQINDPALATITSSHYTAAHVGADGSIWLGTETGVVRYKSGSFMAFGSNEGISEEFTDRLVVDSRQHLWFGGRNGLSMAPISQFDHHSKDQVNQVACRQFESFQFTPSPFGPKTLLASDGGIWIAANSGVLKIPSNRHINSVPPRPQIEDVKLDGKSNKDVSNVEFASGRHRLSIQFGAVSFSSPKNVRVRYKLEGYDSDWIDAQQLRSADYTDLQPGDYQFKVTATNEDGVAAEAERVMTFTVHPRWFETVWFKLVTVLSVIGFSTLSTLVYSRSLRRRNEVLQREINDRRLAETRLTSSEKRFRDLAESTHAIPWEADAQTQQFTFVGNQAVELMGYPVEEWLTEDFWIEHVHPEDREDAVEYRLNTTQRGQNHQFEYRMIAADGSAVWLHDVFHVVMTDGVANRLRGFLVDVTDRRSAEEKAKDYLQQLSRLNRTASLGEMATSIAHEVNQPLFAIVGNAQIAQRLLKQDQPDMKEVREALGEIVGDGNRAASIIDNVRSLTRKEQRATESLDLNQVALDAIKFIMPEIRKRGLNLRTELEDALPAINGNSIELQQVILNLVINGAQAMRHAEKGYNELLLQTTAQNGFVELTVKDHGVGIEQDHLDRLFEPFFTTKPQGTGMGLAINRTIIEAHRGSIWAAANNPCGAEFRFRLPVAESIKS